jgi:hypothetical protein
MEKEKKKNSDILHCASYGSVDGFSKQVNKREGEGNLRRIL